MASITFKGQPTVVLRTYQVLRIGNNENDKNLDFCLNDKVYRSLFILQIYISLSLSLSVSRSVCGQAACNANAWRKGPVSG